MLKKILNAYKKLLDEKIGNGTTVVSLIAILIVMIGSCTPNSQHFKANALEATSFIQHNDIITIDGQKFQISIDKIQ